MDIKSTPYVTNNVSLVNDEQSKKHPEKPEEQIDIGSQTLQDDVVTLLGGGGGNPDRPPKKNG